MNENQLALKNTFLNIEEENIGENLLVGLEKVRSIEEDKIDFTQNMPVINDVSYVKTANSDGVSSWFDMLLNG